MIAILGAGRLGLRVAELMRGQPVRASTRSKQRFDQLKAAGTEPFIVSLDHAQSIRSFLDGVSVLLFSVAPGPSSARELVYGEGLDGCLEALPEQARMIMVSSTAVYDGYDAGEIIDEKHPAKAVSARSKPLLAGEQKLRQALGERAQIVRFAGLYSEGRGPFHYIEPSLRAGKALRGAGGRFLNLIHDHDAAMVLTRMLQDPSLQLVLGSDGRPKTRAHSYGAYARFKKLPEPRFSEASEGLSGRRIIPKSCPIRLAFQSFQQALGFNG